MKKCSSTKLQITSYKKLQPALSSQKEQLSHDQLKQEKDNTNIHTEKKQVGDHRICNKLSPSKKEVEKKKCSLHQKPIKIQEKCEQHEMLSVKQQNKKSSSVGNKKCSQLIQQYITQKRTQNLLSQQIEKLQILLEQKRKLENLVKLENGKTDGFNKQKGLGILKKKMKKSDPKKIKKNLVKIDDEGKKKSKRQLKGDQATYPNKSQSDWNSKKKIPQLQDQKEKRQEKQHKLCLQYHEPTSKLNLRIPQKAIDIMNKIPVTKNLLDKIAQLSQQLDQEYTDKFSSNSLQFLQYHCLTQAASLIQNAWKKFLHNKSSKTQFQMKNKSQTTPILVQQKFKSSNQSVTSLKLQKIAQQYQLNQQKQKIDENLLRQFAKTAHLQKDQKLINSENNNDKIHQRKDQETEKIQFSQRDQIDVQQDSLDKDQQQVIQEIEEQFEQKINFDEFAVTLLQEKKYGMIKQQMKTAIMTLVSQQLNKYKEMKTSEKYQSVNNPEDLTLRLFNEMQVENHFNQMRNKFKSVQEQSLEKSLQLSKDQFTDIAKSSVLQLQSQLMKKEVEVLTIRKDAIQLRYEAEMKKNTNDHDKQLELQEWFAKELLDLQLTKEAIEISIKREASAMKKIQRDLLIVQSFDENNSKLNSLKRRVEEQLNNLKQSRQNSSDFKPQNINQENEIEKLAETLSEDLESDNADHSEQRERFNENVIESYEEMERHAYINLTTNDLIGEIVDDFIEELLISKNKFHLGIQTLIQLSIAPHIPTAIIDMRFYLHSFFGFILQTHYQEIINNLNYPYGFSPKSRLSFIHGYDEEQNYNNFIAFPLAEDLFLEYERYRLSQNQEEIHDRKNVLDELEHIHNKAIFDACNEALNQFRPYYFSNGTPFPWQEGKIYYQVTEAQLSQILKRMELQLLKWAQQLCGFHEIEEDIPVSSEKQTILSEKNQQMMILQMQQIDNPDLYDPDFAQYYDPIIQIQEQRMNQMLMSDLQEIEYKWNQITDDRTELLMQVGDQIFECLIEDFIHENF